MLAAAVAVAFMANPVLAQESGASSQPAMIACLGGNSCKGQSLCKSFDHDCQGMNSCKGKGFVMMTDQQCRDKGGKPIDPDQM
ncbi:MAG: BufA2 family periplasmic bufferin-type metallophore [Candidatus Binatus sp.]